SLDAYEDLYNELLEFRGGDISDALAAGVPVLATPPDLVGVDPDLLHIPLLRLSTLGDLAGMRDCARNYIQALPDSYIGHYYLAAALWRLGNETTALQVFRRALSEPVSDETALRLFGEMQAGSPLGRLATMPLQ